VTNNNLNGNARERLLNEAEKLFAMKGFAAVSVREITHEANCNLAAVNYYFGNKKNLYFDVFRFRILPRVKQVQTVFDAILTDQENISIREIISAFATAFFKSSFPDEAHELHAKLLGREMSEPTGAFEILFEEGMMPFLQKLYALFQKYCPGGIDEEHLKLNILSMLSMVLYFSHAQIPVSRFTGKEYSKDFKDCLMNHVIEFSLNGLGVNEKEETL